MGVDYTQYCILGIRLDVDDIKIVTDEEVYEDQPRYNTKTGEMTKMVSILVKEEQYHYEYAGFTDECLWDLGEQIEKKLDDENISVQHGGEYDSSIYIGKKIGESSEGYCKADLLDGSIDLEDLFLDAEKMAVELEVDPSKIELHFVKHIG